MAESKVSIHGGEVKFTDNDVVNLDNWIPAGEYNPHKVRPWLIHEHGFVIAVVFAGYEQEALDEAVDANKMDKFLIAEEDYEEYGVNTEQEDGVTRLGNAGEPFDIESVEMVELPNPPRSFCSQFNALVGTKVEGADYIGGWPKE